MINWYDRKKKWLVFDLSICVLLAFIAFFAIGMVNAQAKYYNLVNQETIKAERYRANCKKLLALEPMGVILEFGSNVSKREYFAPRPERKPQWTKIKK